MTAALARTGPGVQHFTSTRLTAFERGVEFGRAFPKQIRGTVGFYRDRLSRCPNPDIDLAEGGELALEAIEAFSPLAAQEIQGIAEGAGLPVAEIAGINARTELLALADPDGSVECSTIVSAPPGGPVLGAQTWDWYTALADGWLQWTIPLPLGRWLTTMTEFGVLAKIGLNDAGLGLLFSILHHESDGRGPVGVPVHVLARTVLEGARDVAGALDVTAQAELSASSTFTIVDPSSAASVELFPGGRGILTSDADWIVRSNHFLSPEGAPGCRDHVRGINSQARHRLLSERAGDAERSEAGLVRALADHDPDGCLCVHTGPDTNDGTLATIVIEPGIPSMSVWRGWPCSTPPGRSST